MNPSESYLRLVWYALACLLAVFTYFYGLDSQHIPKNGDEYPYEHIVRLTAASGELLPLQSQMENMRNTKPPLPFWQGIASTGWSKDWTLWQLRYPSVIYTMLTAAMLLKYLPIVALQASSGTATILHVEADRRLTRSLRRQPPLIRSDQFKHLYGWVGVVLAPIHCS